MISYPRLISFYKNLFIFKEIIQKEFENFLGKPQPLMRWIQIKITCKNYYDCLLNLFFKNW